jgi:Transposase DDE domain
VRWRVETHFAQLKTTLKMRKVKSKTSQGVFKELTVYALVYNLVHLVMLRAAERQKVEPDRISFIDTVRWLLSTQPGEKWPDLMVNPRRVDRHEPRVVKDREDTYTKMTRPRAELRKELRKPSLAL